MKSIKDINKYERGWKMDNKKSINTLNQLLQGEQMGVDSFNVVIDKIHCDDMKNSFQKMQEDYRKHSSQLAKRIQDLGGQPNEKLGLKGVMADAMLNINLTANDSDEHVLEKAIAGVGKGVSMAEEIAKGDLDSESEELVKKILDEDRKHISIMNDFKNKIH